MLYICAKYGKKTDKLNLFITEQNLNQYKIFRFILNLPNFISILFQAFRKLHFYLFLCSKLLLK